MRSITFTLAVAALLLASPTLAQPHGEVGVGRNAANQLVPHMHFDQPILLPRSVFPGITGFAISTVGFENVPFDEPDEDLFTLHASADISARLITTDAGVQVYNGLPILAVGESMHFGAPFFDYHPIFNIPSPAAVQGTVFSMRFVLHDASPLYADSEEFEISFTPACPADFNLSGDVSVQDIFDFLAHFFANFLTADFNRSGEVSTQDLFDFLAAFFTPCP